MNIQGYIPSRREINLVPPERSFEELAWGPKLMLEREKESGNTISEMGKGLDFEYWDVDDPKVKPELDALQAEKDSLATELATKGYSPILNQKIVNFRQKYQKFIGPHGVGGRASKNYADGMNQWKEWSKAHEKDPQFYREQVKKQMLGKYKGMWDEDTKSYRGFEAGEVPNYYNLGDDLRTELAKVKGKISELYGKDGASISVRNIGGTPMFEITNNQYGNKVSNSDALTGGLNALSFDYFSPNKNTDRSKFAELMGITPEQFMGMAEEVKRSLKEDYFQSMPGSSTSYQNVPQDRTGNSSSNVPAWQAGFNFPQVGYDDNTLEKDPKYTKQLEKIINIKERLTGKPSTLENSSSWSPKNIWGDIKEAASILDPGYATKEGKPLFERTPEDDKKDIDLLKNEYSIYYKKGMSDLEFINNIEKEVQNRAATTNKYFSMNSKGYNDLTALGIRGKNQLEKVSGKGKDNISYTDLVKGYEGNMGLYNDSSPLFDDDMNILVQSIDDAVYKIKPSTLIHNKYANDIQFLRGLEKDTNVTEDEMKQYSNTIMELAGTDSKYKFIFAKDNKPPYIKKGVIIYDPIRDASGKVIDYNQTPMDLNTFINKAFKSAAMNSIFVEQTSRN